MNYKKLIVDSGKRMAGSGLTVETWGKSWRIQVLL